MWGDIISPHTLRWPHAQSEATAACPSSIHRPSHTTAASCPRQITRLHADASAKVRATSRRPCLCTARRHARSERGGGGGVARPTGRSGLVGRAPEAHLASLAARHHLGAVERRREQSAHAVLRRSGPRCDGDDERHGPVPAASARAVAVRLQGRGNRVSASPVPSNLSLEASPGISLGRCVM